MYAMERRSRFCPASGLCYNVSVCACIWARSSSCQKNYRVVCQWRYLCSMLQGVAHVNNTSLYFEIAGTGHPLVLLHGFGLDSRMWDRQFASFSDSYQVVRYDLRGFGQSALPSPNRPYSHTDDLRELMRYLEIECAHILGLSRGGRWAIQFAIDYASHVTSLITVDAMPNGFRSAENRPSLSPNLVRTARDDGLHAAREGWLNHPIFSLARKKPGLSSSLWEMISDYSGWHWLNVDPLRTDSIPAMLRLSEIVAPTLVIIGEQDVEEFKEAADFLVKNIPDARKVVLEGVGHVANLEAPEKFNEIVLDFLSTVS